MLITIVFGRERVAVPPAWGKLSLQAGIVLLGFGISTETMWQLSRDYTLIVSGYVILAAIIGLLLGRAFGLSQNESLLMSSGTAICGGTTVATISPIIDAKAHETGAALAVIFLLNAIALVAFPFIGQWLELSQQQFGLWAAMAIHDTASVVATAQVYGDEAAITAATVKLGRTLWLIPLVVGLSVISRKDSNAARVPLFVVLFVVASVLGSILAVPDQLSRSVSFVAKSLFVVALFLIGLEVSRETLRSLRFRVVAHAVLLWSLVAGATLVLISVVLR